MSQTDPDARPAPPADSQQVSRFARSVIEARQTGVQATDSRCFDHQVRQFGAVCADSATPSGHCHGARSGESAGVWRPVRRSCGGAAHVDRPPAGCSYGWSPQRWRLARDTMTRFMGLIVIAMGIQFALTGLRACMMASQ